jgi:energy-coupling factor transporter ATP-binding protein EcfA2
MIIEFETVSVDRGARTILSELNISLSESRIGIVGPNGAGKSTFARLINGLITPSTGRVVVNGMVVSDHLDAVRQRVGFLFQNPDNQIVFPVVQEDMAFGLKPSIPDKALRAARIHATLAQLDIADLSDRAIHTLSGGQKQLVALACVLCMQPEVLVLDEPTNDLDTDMLAAIEDLLDTWPGTLIVVSHDRYLVERVTDQQFGLLGDGKLRHLPRGVDEFLQLRQAMASAPKTATGAFTQAGTSPSASKSTLGGAERRALEKDLARAERSLAKLELEQQALATELEAADPSNYSVIAEISERQLKLNQNREVIELAWLEASEKLSGG